MWMLASYSRKLLLHQITEEVDAIIEEINTIMQLDLDLMMNVDNKKRRSQQRHKEGLGKGIEKEREG